MGGQVMGGHHCGCQEKRSFVKNEDKTKQNSMNPMMEIKSNEEP
jgi:hypothetical protein